MAGQNQSKIGWKSDADAIWNQQLGMLMFIVANIVGSTIQITTLPLPVLSTLQAVCLSPTPKVSLS